MQTQQAIRANAAVIRVTNIGVGDVYKRFDASYDDKLYIGIVKGVHNDGNNAIIEALEYCKQYGNVDVAVKILRGDKDYLLFPATPEDFERQLGDVIPKKRREIEKNLLANTKLEQEITEIERILSGEATRDLQAMSYTELSQAEFDSQRQLTM